MNTKLSEQDLINEMQEILQSKMAEDYEAGNTKRDAHPKCLGLVKASFKVADDLPKELKVGVFAKSKTFPAFVRISNAKGNVQSDKQKDFRGFAIKLMQVSGERFTRHELQTQDFLMMSHPTMPLGTVKLFRDAVYYSIKRHPLILVAKLLISGKGRVLSTLKNGKKHDTSPLDITYWSTTPYKFGNQFVKYKLVPTSPVASELPKNLTDSYLTDNMQAHLANHDATFDFFIQPFVNDEQTPIEDASVEWSETVTKPIKVAEVTIPSQVFDVQANFDFAEQLSFSPANALNVHEPVGGLNRARIQIYNALSAFRHQQNKQSIIEPKPSDLK